MRLRSLQLCLFLGLALAVIAWRFPASFSRAEQLAYDVATQYRPNPPPVDELLIVEIDDLSLDDAQLGQFPWPRSVYAELIDRLEPARVVGLDVLLLEKGRLDPSGDAALARSMERHGRVVLPASILEDRVVSAEGTRRLGPFRETLGPAPAPGPVEVERFQPPILLLTEAAAAVGFANLVEDGDGRYRRIRPYYAGLDGLAYPNFACEIARIAASQEPAEMYASEPEALHVAGRRLPLSDDHMWISYAGPAGTVPRVSAADVHGGRVPESALRGKIVLIGATAAGLHDLRPAPYLGRGGRMYGVETNANVVNTLLAAEPLVDEAQWSVIASLPLLALLAWWLVWRRGSSAAATGLIVGALLLIAWYVFGYWALGRIGPIVPRLLALVGVGFVAIVDRIREEARLRARLVDAFAAYVAPEVAERLAEHPDDASLGGMRQEITVMFTDIRGFTTLSEQMDPQAVVAQLTEYFNAMVDAVFRFDGLVDKFIGDGMMVLYGCFDPDADHRRQAILTALLMRQTLARLNARWRSEGRPEFRIGIGIHSGPAIVGNMGAERKWNFTAAGDTVNTAARIDELCKGYSHRWETTILVSEWVAGEVGELAETERIGEVDLRGRQEAASIYAIVPGPARDGGSEVTTNAALEAQEEDRAED
jgi:adenylate cyclase